MRHIKMLHVQHLLCCGIEATARSRQVISRYITQYEVCFIGIQIPCHITVADTPWKVFLKGVEQEEKNPRYDDIVVDTDETIHN